MSGLPNKFTFNFDGEEYLRDMAAGGKRRHADQCTYRNWEIAGFGLLKRLDTKINIVMFDGEHKQIKEYLDKIVGDRHVNIIVVKRRYFAYL